MANTKSAQKNIRKTARRTARNQLFSGRARTLVKRTRDQIRAGNLDEARATAQLAAKALDKAAQKNIIHANNAARRKSRLMKALNEALEARATG